MSNETNNIHVYAEPEGIDYIIIKVKESVINGEHVATSTKPLDALGVPSWRRQCRTGTCCPWWAA